jgi:hypothetical protein
MPLKTPWTDQDQYRAGSVDTELQAAMLQLNQALDRIVSAKKKHIAQNLSALWPTLVTDYVHVDRTASTRQEQLDISNFIDHAVAVLRNEGATTLTAVQSKSILDRYAR